MDSPLKVPFVDLRCQHQPLQAEIEQAIGAVLERGDFVLGEALRAFETAFAEACGVEYGVGVASGTAAIAIGLQAMGVGAGDEVLVPANTFIATVIGVLQAGATAVLVDCDRKTALIDLEDASRRVTAKTKAIVPVHLYGQLVSPQEVRNFASQYNLLILEDAAQAHLARREGQIAGSLGDCAAFSFYPSKNLGAFGNGGMLVTPHEAIALKARSLRNYGAPQKYLHADRGTNSRLDTLQAAILNVKLPHLKDWNQARRVAAQCYKANFAAAGLDGWLTPLEDRSPGGHAYHLFVVCLQENPGCDWLCQCAERDREKLREQLSLQGIQTGIHYPIPCHLQPAYRFLGYQEGDFPVTEALCRQILSLPMYPGIDEQQIDWVCHQLEILAVSPSATL
ncbi:MAG: DegT/DnrJ/EryC1/StrS family aminotransferase [Chloroflexaceae bacterium]|nr:DegT/DnrJ/EryC1/StrS family aminotransferase [Chloroflexaceae bacterium]